jgi:hypothetical protein
MSANEAATSAAKPIDLERLFRDYLLDGAFDEMRTPEGGIRPHYQALVEALADCNQSLKLKPDAGAILDSPAYTDLKMKRYGLAMTDYDHAIHLYGDTPLWLYGRGLAKRAKNDAASAKADMAVAVRMDAKIVDRYRKLGFC